MSSTAFAVSTAEVVANLQEHTGCPEDVAFMALTASSMANHIWPVDG